MLRKNNALQNLFDSSLFMPLYIEMNIMLLLKTQVIDVKIGINIYKLLMFLLFLRSINPLFYVKNVFRLFIYKDILQPIEI